MSDEEIWKPIPGFDDYEASNLGHIRSWKGKSHGSILSPALNSSNPGSPNKQYYCVNLLGNDNKYHFKRIGVLVLLAFVGNRPLGFHMCHKDDNSINDRLENLYWGTPKQNGQDRHRNNLVNGVHLKSFIDGINERQRQLLRGYLCKRMIDLYWSEQNQRLDKNDLDYYSLPKLAKMFHMDQSAISLIVNGKRNVKLIQAVA